MKKFLVLIPAVILLLTGCGEKKGTISCTLNLESEEEGYQLEAEYIIHYKGDNAEYVESKETVISDDEDILEYFESLFDQTYSGMNESYGGYTFNSSKANGKITSTVKVDYTKMDLDKLVQDQPTMKIYIKDNKMSKDGLQATYEAMGATCE